MEESWNYYRYNMVRGYILRECILRGTGGITIESVHFERGGYNNMVERKRELFALSLFFS